nr:hypothetical protein [Bacteroidota bacterium]
MRLLSLPNPPPRKFDMSGYDMDKGNIRVRVEHSNGSSTLLPSNVFSLQTHYHATVDFSNVNMTTTMIRFVVAIGETRLSEVAIIQKPCETKNYPTTGTFAGAQTKRLGRI